MIAVNNSSQRLIHFRAFQEQNDKRFRKLIQDIYICWNSMYLMLCQVYQLREFVDLWTEKYCKDFKIAKIKFNESKWFMILLVNNLLNLFYECTLIMLQTTNADIHLRFRIFNALFNHLEQIEKNIRRSTCSLSAVIVKTCEKVSIKLAKYYVKIEDSNETIYNLANILNSTIKLNLYKIWNNKDNVTMKIQIMMKSLFTTRSSTRQNSKSIFIITTKIQLLIWKQKHKEQEVMLIR